MSTSWGKIFKKFTWNLLSHTQSIGHVSKLLAKTTFYYNRFQLVRRHLSFSITGPGNWPSFHLQTVTVGLPWWLSGKESAGHCGRHGFIPGRGRSHVPWDNEVRGPELLAVLWSHGAATTEACVPRSLCSWQETPPQ